MPALPAPTGLLAWLTFGWGVCGVGLVLTRAIVRVLPVVFESFTWELSATHLTVAALWTAFMLVAEGYRGFHKRFAPRVVQRSLYVAAEGTWLQRLLAPAFAMGYFHASRRRMISSWMISLMIVLVVIAVRQLSQPWRGLLDLGVISGLAFGLGSVLLFARRAALGHGPDVPLDLPEGV